MTPLGDSRAPQVTVAGVPGYLFRAEQAGGFCFVPAEFVRWSSDGAAVIDTVGYFQSGWVLRNPRRADSDPNLKFGFPDSGSWVSDLSEPAVMAFLARLESHNRGKP